MMRAAVLLACAALSACGTNSYCLSQQEYQKAEVAPDLRQVSGLELPDSPSALRLPPPPATSVPFGTKGEDGTGVCLDKPPRLAMPSKPAGPMPEEAKPVS